MVSSMAPPGRGAAPDGALGVDVGAERVDDEGEVAGELVELEVGDALGALVGEGPDVEVLAVAALGDEVCGDVAELVGAVGDVEHHHAAALEEAQVVFSHAEDHYLALAFVPVAPDALEHRCAVVQGVGHHAHLGVGEGHDTTTEEG